MTKSLTDPTCAPKYEIDDPVNNTCKKKHHITYLAQQVSAFLKSNFLMFYSNMSFISGKSKRTRTTKSMGSKQIFKETNTSQVWFLILNT